MLKLAIFALQFCTIQAVVCYYGHKENHKKESNVDIHTLKAPECAAPIEEECNTTLIYRTTSKGNMFVNEYCCLNHKDKEMLGCAMFALDPEEQPEHAAKAKRSANQEPIEHFKMLDCCYLDNTTTQN